MKVSPNLAMIAIAGLLPLAAPAFEAQGSFERTLKVSGAVDLEIETGSGRIEVRNGDVASVEIRGTIHAQSGSGMNAEEKVRALESNPPIRQNGSSIRIGGIEDWSLRRNVSISYEIVTPAETRLRAQTGSGRVIIRGLRGRVNASTGSGQIELDEITGAVEAHTGSGGIHGSRIAGAIIADTGSGGVQLEQTNAANVEAHTGSGGVTIRVPAEAAFDLRAHTGSGSITVDHPMTVSGTIGRHDLQAKVRGGGSTLIDLRTGSGSIRIE
jgi:DUF4097 and DUF4098 domain-containing protein YvlB